MKIITRIIRATRRCAGSLTWAWGFIGCLLLPSISGAVVEQAIPCFPEPTDMVMQYGDIVTCQIDVLVDADLFRFSASAGEVIVLQISRLSGNGTSFIELFAPNGKHISSSAAGRIDALLNQTATHIIHVTEFFNNQTISYALTLQCITGVCPDTIVNFIAIFFGRVSWLAVAATSSAAPEAELFVTVPGCVTNAPMPFSPSVERYLFLTGACSGLDGVTATVTSSLGGMATTVIR